MVCYYPTNLNLRRHVQQLSLCHFTEKTLNKTLASCAMLTNEDISTVLILSVPGQLVLDAQARLRIVQPLNSLHVTTYIQVRK